MKRYGLKYRLNSYNEGQFYTLIPTGRKTVAPGEKLSRLVVDTRFITPVFARYALNPVLVQAWAFYVPYRLLWDQWIDFIANDDVVTGVPTTTIAAPIFFDGSNASPRSVFMRRAYKLIYNQFFGDEAYQASKGTTNVWFDVNDDSVVTLGRLLIWDQYRSHMRERSYSSQNYLAAVSGAQATIVLDDLQRALRENRARRRQKMTGDKYVDTMRLMGVELDWRVQMAPEFLGSSQQVVFPEEKPSTSSGTAGDQLGYRACGINVQHQLVMKRPAMFAEHGLVVTCIGVRPLLSINGTSAGDSQMVNLVDFYRPDTAGEPFDNFRGGFETRNSRYLRGQAIVGNSTGGFTWFDSGATDDIYPVMVSYPVQLPPDEGTSQVCAFSDIAFGGLTPVRDGVA